LRVGLDIAGIIIGKAAGKRVSVLLMVTPSIWFEMAG
jgi:hypothetical protein